MINIKRFLIILIILASLTYGIIIPDKNYVSVDYTMGSPYPQQQITFTNNENTTETINLSLSDEISEMIILSDNSISIGNNSSETVLLNFNFTDVSPGVYSGKILLSPEEKVIYSEIPVFITVNKAESSECRLMPEITADYQTIQVGTPAFNKRYNIRVSDACTGGVEITNVYLIGTVQTPDGEKPVRLSGTQSLGFKNPGEQASFNLLFDVSGLEKRTYEVTAKVVGNHDGEQVFADITISVTVTRSAIPGNVSFSQLPSCTLPSQMNLNTTYSFICNGVMPNINIIPQYNEYFEGLSVEEPADQFVYKIRPLKEGKTTFIAYFSYKNAPIGTPFKQEVNIVSGGVESISRGNLTFRFYPDINNIVPGKMLVVECRDSNTNTIVKDCDLYINGIKNDNKTFIPNAGETYYLSLDAPGYFTSDMELTISQPGLNIYITPDNPLVGDIITITVKDNITNKDVDAKLYLDGNEINDTITLDKSGNFTIRAVKEGYIEGEKTFYVKQPVMIKYAPKEIKKNSNVTISLTENSTWEVIYKDIETNTREEIAKGSGDFISFIPTKSGVYMIYANGNRLYSYELKSGFEFNFGNLKYVLFVIIGIIIVYIIIKFLSGRKRIPEPLPSFELKPVS